MTPKHYLFLARRTLAAFVAHHSLRMSAALSYYTLLSMAPLILIVLSLAGLWWDRPAAAAKMIDEMNRFLGPAGAEMVRTILDNAQEASFGFGAGFVGLGATLFAAAIVFLSLQDAVNVIWRVQPKKGRRLWSSVKKRLFSLAMILIVGVLLFASVVITTSISALQRLLSYEWTEQLFVWQTVNFFVSALIISLLFGAIYRYLPDMKLHWRDVALGAGVAGVLFVLGKMLLGLYLSRLNLGKAYGAAGSIVIFLVWVYYSSVIMLAGAELTRVQTLLRRPDVEPSSDAEWAPHHRAESANEAWLKF